MAVAVIAPPTSRRTHTRWIPPRLLGTYAPGTYEPVRHHLGLHT
ncbi:hypothetical protein ACIQ9E_06975 [Streptomyces sp. NPDC094448]